MLTPDTALLAARFCHFLAVFQLCGMGFFALYAGAPLQGELMPRLAPAGIALGLVAVLSGLGWFLVQVAAFGGAWQAIDGTDTLFAVVVHTHFGRVWAVRTILTLALLPILLGRDGPMRRWLLAIVAGALAASLALIGHASDDTGLRRLLHEGNHAIHLLAVSTWIGGLWPLARLLRDGTSSAQRLAALHRFSTIAMLAVGLILSSGFANMLLVSGAPLPALDTRWGWTLMFKLLLVTAMMICAAINRALLMPSGNFGRIRHIIALEQILALAVLGASSLLGTLSPDPMG